MRDMANELMSRSILVSALAVGALMLGAEPAAAETATAPSDDTGLETIVVTAQRRSEDIQTVPITIQAFTGRDIEELGIRSSTDIAQFTSNVEIALPSGAGNQPLISIRGIGLNDYDTNNAGPNGVYLDEVYLSAPSSQTFSTFDLQGIEVLKGPQGTLYGRNTSGGAINIVTVKPSDEFSANFHTDYGSFNTANIEGAVGGPLTPTLDGRFAASVNHSDGYMHNLLTGNHENGTNNFAVRGMLQYKPTDNMKILVNVHGGQVDNRPTEYRHIGVLNPATGAQCLVAQAYAGQCVDAFGYGTPANFYDGSFNRQQHLRVTNAGGYVRVDYGTDGVDLTSISAIEYNNKLHPEDSDASPNRLLEINYGVRSTNYSQEVRAAQTRERYDWVAGAYFLHEDLYQNQPLFAFLDGDTIFGAPGAFDGVAFRAFDDSHQATNAYAAFGQGEYKFTDELKLILGGRFTDEHKSFHYEGSIQPQQGGMDNFGPLTTLNDSSERLSDSAVSWRAGLNYNFTPDVLAYASVATGFKSGDFNGSFLSTIPAEILRQLVPVRPEKVTAYELGIKASLFDRHVIFDAAAFYNDYHDMQVFVLVPPVAGGSGLPINVLDNAKKAHTDGVDLTLTVKPISAFTVTVQAGVLQTKLDQYRSKRDPSLPDYSGNQLPLAPHVSGSIMLDYKIPLLSGALDLQANANYKGHVFFDVANDPFIDQSGYWLENMRLAYTFSGGHWEAAAYVHNLSDKQYYNDKFDLSSPFGFIQGIVGVPRTLGAEVNWRY
jgi:iron complex outermembrane recepter protein